MLSQATHDKIEAFTDMWPDAEFGPAHIVLSDSNIEDVHIDWCITLIDAALNNSTANLNQSDADMMRRLNMYAKCERNELEATRVFLRELRTIPEADR